MKCDDVLRMISFGEFARMANWPLDISTNKPEGWSGEHAIPNRRGFERHMALYVEIVQWILKNIEDPKENAQWNKVGDCIYVYIRRPRDFTMYSLKYGHE